MYVSKCESKGDKQGKAFKVCVNLAVHISEKTKRIGSSNSQQECIPVGCVPTAAVAISFGGGGVVCLPGGGLSIINKKAG